jgi:hypothetical protein
MFNGVFVVPSFGATEDGAKRTIAIALIPRIEMEFQEAIVSDYTFVAWLSFLKGHRGRVWVVGGEM